MVAYDCNIQRNIQRAINQAVGAAFKNFASWRLVLQLRRVFDPFEVIADSQLSRILFFILITFSRSQMYKSLNEESRNTHAHT